MLTLKSYHSAGAKKQLAWNAVRRFMPARTRLFYEGCISIPGQLWYHEREALYNAIRTHKPKTVFEVGTWYGGGSTFFIAQALHDNGQGLLCTVEPNRHAFENAVAGYKRDLPQLLPYVKFFCGSSTEIFPEQLKKLSKVDSVFLDGAQDGRQTAQEFEIFKPYLHEGSILMAHDWDNDKMEVIRPQIEQAREWQLETRLTLPQSLGFVVYRRLAFK